MPPPNLAYPVFSDSLKLLINSLPCKPAKLLQKLIGLEDIEKMECSSCHDARVAGRNLPSCPMATPANPSAGCCGCADCVKEAAPLRAKLSQFNRDCGMNYFSWREKDGMISYLPAGKEMTYGPDGRTWSRKCRQEIAPGRFVRKVLSADASSKLKDDELSLFTQQFNAKEEEEKVTFSLVGVQEAYNSDVQSCMRKHSVGAFYDMFDCKALIAKQRGNIIARAVLWNDVDGQPYKANLLDRVYPNEGSVTEAMLGYAREKGWFTKFKQGQGQEQVWDAKNEVELSCKDWKIPCLTPEKLATAKPDYFFFPYLDTFSYSDKDCTYLSKVAVKKGWVYLGQGGQRERDKTGLVECRASGQYFDSDDCIMIGGYWYAKIHCVTCKISGAMVPRKHAFELREGDQVYYVSREFCRQA